MGNLSLGTTHQALPIHTDPKFKPKGESKMERDIRQNKAGESITAMYRCAGCALNHPKRTILIRPYVNSAPIELDLDRYTKV